MISSVKYHRNATNILINQKQDKNQFLIKDAVYSRFGLSKSDCYKVF